MKTKNTANISQTNKQAGMHRKKIEGERTMTRMIIQNGITRSLGASLMVLALASAIPTTAFAVSPASIDNTATVNGQDPAGTPLTPVDSNPVEVDLDDPDNVLTISKSFSFIDPADGVTNGDIDVDGEGDAGDTVYYSYTITNGGNTTLSNVGVNDTAEGGGVSPTFLSGAPSTSPTVGASTITLAPGESAIFRAAYTITTTDINTLGGTSVLGLDNDGNLDNSAQAEGDFVGAVTVPVTSVTPGTASVPLDADSSMTLAKAAYEGSPIPADIANTGLGSLTAAAAERPVGTVITYVYTLTNDGDVPISSIVLSDEHTNAGGTSTVTPTFNSVTTTSPASSATTLYPGGIAYFTYQYTITQADIDAQ